VGDPTKDEAHAGEMINSITSLQELLGYEIEAKKRGLSPHEVKLIHDKRKMLTPKRKRKR
jgi:hypothetical protein